MLTSWSNWPTKDENGNPKVAQAVIFGLGSMFNHSTQNQNVVWERDVGREMITYRALRDIPAGEELCEWKKQSQRIHQLNNLGISYGSHLTFIDTDAAEPEEEDINQLNQIELD